MSVEKAGRLATKEGLDLIEVSAKANPPVVKMMDYGKFKYEQAKKTKKQTYQKTKDVKFRPNIDVHDMNVKVRNIEKFLSKGFKVRVVMMFRGREIANTKLGFDTLNRILETVSVEYFFDKKPKLEGRNIITILKGE